jgi:hypothetical protein
MTNHIKQIPILCWDETLVRRAPLCMPLCHPGLHMNTIALHRGHQYLWYSTADQTQTA